MKFDVLEKINTPEPRRYAFEYDNGTHAINHVGITGEWMSPKGWMPIVNGNTKKFLYDKYIR